MVYKGISRLLFIRLCYGGNTVCLIYEARLSERACVVSKFLIFIDLVISSTEQNYGLVFAKKQGLVQNMTSGLMMSPKSNTGLEMMLIVGTCTNALSA